MQSVSSRNWNRFAVSISYNDNHVCVCVCVCTRVLENIKKKNMKSSDDSIYSWIICHRLTFWFYGISNFVGYLMPNPF